MKKSGNRIKTVVALFLNLKKLVRLYLIFAAPAPNLTTFLPNLVRAAFIF